MLPATLLREFRARWEAGKATWNAFAGIPCQVGGRKGHLEHFRWKTVAGGRQRKTPGTLSRGFRGRWKAEKRHLEHFRWKTVAGGRQRKTPGTLSRGFRARWEAGRDTWNAFAGIPCQVGSRKGHLERFRRNTVAGGRRERTSGTLSRENRARWAIRGATCHAFAGIPCQVGSEKCYLEHFHGNSVPGGRQEDVTWNAFAEIPCQVDSRERTPDTLLQEYRGRWTANLSDTGRDSAMKMKIMENLLLFVVNSYFRRAKKWKHANHG